MGSRADPMRTVPRQRPSSRLRTVRVVKGPKTLCVGIYGVSAHLNGGDGYIVLAGEKVLLKKAQLIELFGKEL